MKFEPEELPDFPKLLIIRIGSDKFDAFFLWSVVVTSTDYVTIVRDKWKQCKLTLVGCLLLTVSPRNHSSVCPKDRPNIHFNGTD